MGWRRFRDNADLMLRSVAQFGGWARTGDLLRRADSARDRRDFETAADLYGKVLASDPSLSEIQVQCGHMNKEAGRLRVAEEHYLRALAAVPDDPDLRLQLGHLYKIMGRLGEAACAYYWAATLQPGWAEPLGELCAIYETWGTGVTAVLSDRCARKSMMGSSSTKEVELVGLHEWATLTGTPPIQVRGPGTLNLAIDWFLLSDLRSKEVLPAPISSFYAVCEASSDVHIAQPSDVLEDGPYIVIVRSTGDGQLLEMGAVVIDALRKWRSSYPAIVEEERRQVEVDRAGMLQFTKDMLFKPQFLILLEGNQPQRAASTKAALDGQVYSNWTACHFDGCLTKEILDSHPADFVIWLRDGDELRADALFEFASAINAWPETDMFYANEDRRHSDGQPGNPFFKPGWSPDYLEVFNYVGRPACFRAAVGRQFVSATSYYDFTLRFCERTDRIRHIRRILCTVDSPPHVARNLNVDQSALAGRLERTGRKGSVIPLDLHGYGWKIRLELARTPLVSIILPSAGRTVEIDGKSVELLPNVLSSIFSKSTYRNFEVVIIHNGDLKPEHAAGAVSLGCRLVRYNEPQFNISRKLNQGVRDSRGDIVLLLNDDTEIVSEDWIERLLEHFEKAHVGVVGAKLLYPNGDIQHAGVVINCGDPDHVVRGMPADHAGYFLSTCGVHNYVAVTGACMMTRRDLYLSVAGFSEDLAISFNDVDYCQKVRATGKSIVYSPEAVLIHFESQSREPRLDPREAEIYQSRWAAQDVFDPFYDEINLSIRPPTFDVTFNGRTL